jgi:hypothetical protein
VFLTVEAAPEVTAAKLPMFVYAPRSGLTYMESVDVKEAEEPTDALAALRRIGLIPASRGRP